MSIKIRKKCLKYTKHIYTGTVEEFVMFNLLYFNRSQHAIALLRTFNGLSIGTRVYKEWTKVTSYDVHIDSLTVFRFVFVFYGSAGRLGPIWPHAPIRGSIRSRQRTQLRSFVIHTSGQWVPGPASDLGPAYDGPDPPIRVHLYPDVPCILLRAN